MDFRHSKSGRAVPESTSCHKFRPPMEILEATRKELDFCTAETIFRDGQGKILKIVTFDASGTTPVLEPSKPPAESACGDPCGSATTPIDEPKKINSATITKVRLVAEASTKFTPEGQAPSSSLTKTVSTKKEEATKPPEKTKEKVGVSSRLLILPLVRKLSDTEHKKPVASHDASPSSKSGTIKEPAESVKKFKPAPKLSKHAEIMAKLQSSIAQEKTKPKKEIKSRVFSTTDNAKDDSGFNASRSHSRASSAAPSSVQLSPMDGVTLTNPDSKHSPAESIGTTVSNTSIPMTNGTFKKPISKIAEKKVTKVFPSKKDPVTPEIAKPFPWSKKQQAPLPPKVPQVQRTSSKQSLLPPIQARKLPSKTAKDSENDSNLKEKLNEQQLVLARQHLDHNSKAFDVMCILMKHASEQVIPGFQTALTKLKNDLDAAKEHSGQLTAENGELLTRISAMCTKYDSNMADIKAEYEANEKMITNSLQAEQSKNAELQSFMEKEIKHVIEDFAHKEALLVQNNQVTLEKEAKQEEQKISALKEDYERKIIELKELSSKEMDQFKSGLESCRADFQGKILESQQMCEKYRKEAKMLEASLMADSERKMQVIKERYVIYEQEIDSLRAVLEMKSTEIHDLRAKNQTLEKELENYSSFKAKIAVLEQKNRELTEALEMKKLAEQRLSQKHLELRIKLERECESAQRLCMTNEELQYRLQQQQQQNLMSQSVYATPSGGFYSVADDDGHHEAPFGSAKRRSTSSSMTSSMLMMPSSSSSLRKAAATSKSVTSSPKMTSSMTSWKRTPSPSSTSGGMSQSLVQVYANMSPRSASGRQEMPVTVYSTDGVTRTLCFERGAGADGSAGHKRRSASERSAGTMFGLNLSALETSPYVPSLSSKNAHDSADFPAPEKRSSSMPNKRRMSPFRSSNASSNQPSSLSSTNSSMIGAPGVETVFEEACPNCDVKKAAEKNDPHHFPVSSSTSGFRVFTDSGVFTGSSDLLTALDRRPSEEQPDPTNQDTDSNTPSAAKGCHPSTDST